MIRLATLAMVLATLIAACGHRGPLVPPAVGSATATKAADDMEKGES